MSRKKGEDKAKLEHKLYLARETPEPIFDVSDCGIKNVPNGIYSLCHVFRKDTLKLDHNYISSFSGGGQLIDLKLIKVLDIQHNVFEYLPDDIHLLNFLKELYINNNHIKKLPDSICRLTNLEIFDISNNYLKELPQNFGKLVNLKSLNILRNPIYLLPKSLCKAQKLTNLNINSEGFIYPPKEIIEKGSEEIIKFICNDVGVEYNYSKNVEPEESPKEKVEDSIEIFQKKIWRLETLKKQKLNEFLEIEKANEILQKQELELANAQKLNRDKVLAHILEEENKLQLKFKKIQQIKETERFRLIEQIQEAQHNADAAIKKLLCLSSQPSKDIIEWEKKEEKRLMADVAAQKHNEDLRTTDIIANMQDILQQETEKFQKMHKIKEKVNKTILEREIMSDNHLSEILANRDLYKTELLSKLEENNELQKAAVGTLLERGDARSWSLVQQVRLVESQLAGLTNLEMDKRKLEIDHQLNDLAEKRINLSILLIELLDQQAQRRNELISTLQALEENSIISSEDFWLRQYQRLLDNLPQGLNRAQKNIDPALIQTLLINNVIHCLPFLAKLTQSQCQIGDITKDKLRKAGITNPLDISCIMDAFYMYKKNTLCDESVPSAPTTTEETASAPPFETSFLSAIECVICMDDKCELVFVPCGHICCCTSCSGSLSHCPLCRCEVQRKVFLLT